MKCLLELFPFLAGEVLSPTPYRPNGEVVQGTTGQDAYSHRDEALGLPWGRG